MNPVEDHLTPAGISSILEFPFHLQRRHLQSSDQSTYRDELAAGADRFLSANTNIRQPAWVPHCLSLQSAGWGSLILHLA